MVTPEAPEDGCNENPEGASESRRLGCGRKTTMRDNTSAGDKVGDWTETNSLETHAIDGGERTLLYDGQHPSDAVDSGRWLAAPTTEVER